MSGHLPEPFATASLGRVRECTDALTGIADPATELARLRACEVALRRMARWYAAGRDPDPELVEAANTALKR